MFVKVNRPRCIVMLRPRLSTFEQQSWQRIATLAKAVVIVTEEPVADWRSRTSLPMSFFPVADGVRSDVQTNLRIALEAMGFEPHDAVSVCFDRGDLPEAVLTRTGTALVRGPLFGTLPDVFLDDVVELAAYLDGGRGSPLGYLAEQRCSLSYG